MEENSFLVKLEYKVELGGWFTKPPKGSNRVGLWKTIRKESTQLKNNCTFVLGDGRRIRFW